MTGRTPSPRIAVLGAGHVGPVIARIAVAADLPVSIAASGDPAEIALITEILAPGAEPLWARGGSISNTAWAASPTSPS